MDIETRMQIKRMCDIVLNNASINKELDSLALEIGHDQDIINVENEYYKSYKRWVK
jgi:hypothetical protein